jgi:hypothetical protein
VLASLVVIAFAALFSFVFLHYWYDFRPNIAPGKDRRGCRRWTIWRNSSKVPQVRESFQQDRFV